MGNFFEKNPQYLMIEEDNINEKYEEFEKNHK